MDKITPKAVAELSKIAAEIRSIRSECEAVLRRGAACAKRVGELLLKAQPLCNRQWAKWLAVEFDMVTETAKKYMKIAENWDRVESHEKFPNIGVLEMYDIARGRQHHPKKYSAGCVEARDGSNQVHGKEGFVAKCKRIVINNGKLWPSTLQCGPITIQFQTGKHGRRVTVTSKRHKPRHKRHVKG